jgi:hypothetical protein
VNHSCPLLPPDLPVLPGLLAARYVETNALDQHSSGNQKAEEEAKKDADKKIKEIQEASKKGQDKVIKDLLNAVFEVKPVVPDRIEVPH